MAKRPFFFQRVHDESATTLFILVSALDVFMTYLMVTQGRFVESNPVAAFFLHRWGLKGLIYFKFAVTAFVCVLTQVIGSKRPETAKRVLQLSTVIVSAVVCYSVWLVLQHGLFADLSGAVPIGDPD